MPAGPPGYLRVSGADRCCRASKRNYFFLRRERADTIACAAACSATARCAFFTVEASTQCTLCSGCRMLAGQMDPINGSWAKGWTRAEPRSLGALIAGLLGEHVQGDYSRGAAARAA